MIKQAFLITALILASFTTQADVLVISGSLKTTLSGKGIKTQKYQERIAYYLYEDGTYISYDGEDSGTYTKNGNSYTLKIDPELLSETLAEDGLYLDDYTSLNAYVKINKKVSKASVSSNIKLWVSDDNGDQIKLGIKQTCKCAVTKIID
jgi:phage baseplate assembly protein gpV